RFEVGRQLVGGDRVRDQQDVPVVLGVHADPDLALVVRDGLEGDVHVRVRRLEALLVVGEDRVHDVCPLGQHDDVTGDRVGITTTALRAASQGETDREHGGQNCSAHGT